VIEVAKTRVDEVYREIRLAILNGDLVPGSKLRSAVLGEAYDVSSGVLREVLTKLAGEGLVRSQSQRGFSVVDVSPDDLRQLTESRVLVESELVKQSVASGDLDFEAALMASHHRLSRIPMFDAGRPSPEWLDAHREFHAQLLAGSPNLRLRGIAASLREAAEVYLCWSRTVSGDVERDVAGEHQQLTDAALARKPDHAAALLKAHIERTTQALLLGQESKGSSQ
jgi:DNA-binding GntR family transcriptional regulator